MSPLRPEQPSETAIYLYSYTVTYVYIQMYICMYVLERLCMYIRLVGSASLGGPYWRVICEDVVAPQPSQARLDSRTGHVRSANGARHAMRAVHFLQFAAGCGERSAPSTPGISDGKNMKSAADVSFVCVCFPLRTSRQVFGSFFADFEDLHET